MELNVIPDNFEAQQDNLPFPAPFILSSVEKAWCMNDSAKVLYIKRRHLEENLKTIADGIGMDEAEQTRFLSHWCQPANRDPSEPLAEVVMAFDLRQRAESWMEKARPKSSKPQQSRIERYAESARQFFQSQEIPAGPAGASGFGYADIPDEQ